MEQTVNTFSKGLQIDTHPMILGNDTLSNALNATFVTMKGNEVILQNDTGNRRVDSAFLPAGYEPVGIKEHGGIIYIASYNPITNKGQIGSFPSPQLNYGNVENIKATINESLFNEYFTDSKFGDNIKFLKNFSLLSPFKEEESTKNLILHSGDKFCVYSKDLGEEEYTCWDTRTIKTKNLLTNYDNIYNKSKIYSPKNKKYTLSIGVLNSQNEFIDFTYLLKRWNNNEKTGKSELIKFESNTPDYIKFNTGYFIPLEFNNPFLKETENDSEFIASRLKLPANTYVYKLSGPLYIRKTLNTIYNVTYNVFGEETNDGQYNIILDLYYEYNCPDLPLKTAITEDLDDITEDLDDKYYSYEEYLYDENINYFIGSHISTAKYDSNKKFEELNWNNKNSELKEINDELINTFVDNRTTITYEKPKYNPLTNTYKVIKHYKGKINANLNDLYALRIVPLTTFGYGIRNLSFLDIIDISKLKTNEIDINTFLFKLSENCMKIKLGFKGYMAGLGAISDIKMVILDCIEGEIIDLETYSWPGGINGDEEFEFELSEETKRRIFLVAISWNVNTGQTSQEYAASRISGEDYSTDDIELENYSTEDHQIRYRWLVTTGLFDDFYGVILDYGNTDNQKFKDTCKINIIESDIIDNGNSTIEEVESFTSGNNSVFSNTGGKNELIYGQSKKTTLSNKKIKLKLSDLYPREIEANFKYNGNKSIFTKLNIINDDESVIETYLANSINSYIKIPYSIKEYGEYKTTGFNENSLEVEELNNNTLKINYNGTFLIKEFILGNYTLYTERLLAENVFKSIFETELSEEKLFDECGSIGVYVEKDRNDHYHRQVNYTFLNSKKPKNNTILSDVQLENSYSRGFYYQNQQAQYHNEIDTEDKEYVEGKEEYYWTIDEAINNLLSESKLDNTKNIYPNFKTPYKNFFIGSTDCDIITNYISSLRRVLSYSTVLNKANLMEKFFSKKSAPMRPIMLWMKAHNGWAILPLKDPSNLVYSLTKRFYTKSDKLYDKNLKFIDDQNFAEDEDRDNYYNNIIKKVANNINEDYFKEYGYMGLNEGISNTLILEYLKTRIQNFFYIANTNVYIPSGTFYKLDSSTIEEYSFEKLLLNIKLGISININATETLNTKLFNNNTIPKVFEVGAINSNIDVHSATLLYNKNIQKLDLNTNNNSIKYVLYDNNKYYLNPPGISFYSNDSDKKSIFIKLQNGLFERTNIQILDWIHNADGSLFPLLDTTIGKSGIGVMGAEGKRLKVIGGGGFNNSEIIPVEEWYERTTICFDFIKDTNYTFNIEEINLNCNVIPSELLIINNSSSNLRPPIN